MVNRNVKDRLRYFSRISALIAGTIGAMVIIGWLFDITFFKSILPGFATMKFNAALCFVFSGISLWLLNNDKPALLNKIVLFSCLFFILMMSSLSLYEYFFQKNIGIDEMFMKEDLLLVQTSYPGRMPPLTGIGFLFFMLASVILFFKVKNYRIANALSLVLLGTALFTICGYFYNAQMFDNVLFYNKVAIHASFEFLILSIGLLTVQGDKGLIAFLSSDTVGGIIVRRLLPPLIFLQLFLGWLQLQGEKHGWYESAFGETVFNLIEDVILVVVIVWNAKRIIQEDSKRKEAEKLLIESQEVARIGSYKTDFTKGFWESSAVLDEIFGIDKDYVRSIEGWSNIIYSEDSKTLNNYLNEEVIEKKQKFDKEYRISRVNDGVVRWVHGLGDVKFDENGNIISMIGTIQDITEKKINELALKEKTDEIKLNESRLNSLVNILQYESDSVQEFLDYALIETIGLTSSKIGYICHYSEEKKEFILNSWSDDIMKACTVVEEQRVYQLDKIGIWGEAVRQRKPIMVNDFQAANMLKKGYPQGHVHLDKYLTVPIFINNIIVGVVAVANKSTDYNEKDVLQLTLLMNAVWKVVDRKLAEDKLRESEERYRSVAKSASDAIVSSDSKGIIIDWNPGAEKIFGYTEEETIGKNLDVIIPLDYHAHHINGMKRLELGGEPRILGKTQELYGLHKRGNEFPIELSLSKWETVSGEYFTAIIRDITIRKQVEEIIKKSEAKWRSLFEILPVGVSVVDSQNVITDSNSSLAKIMKVPLDGFLKGDHVKRKYLRSDNTLMSPEEFPSKRALKEQKNIQNVEIGVEIENGTVVWTNVSAAPLSSGEGSVIVTSDITERKRAEYEKQLADTEIRTLSKAIEQSPVTTIITDAAGNIVFVNPKFTESTGYTAKEVIGKNSRILKTEYKPSEEYKELWSTILSGRNWQGIFQNKRKNGELYWESAVISPVKDKDGTITHFLAVKEDITKRKLAEEKRIIAEQTLKEHAEQLTYKNTQLSDFCNIVSHNLRGPLVNISMLVDFFESSLDEEEKKEMLGKFKPAINNLNESFNELVESLQVKNDHEIQSEKIIVKDCLQKITDGMGIEINKYGASIDTDLSKAPVINYPPKYLNSILFNLVNNALKYKSPERKPIIKIRTEKINDSIVLSVADNGLGINLVRHKNDLFKMRKVFHEHPDAKGFGLFMTKTQVEAMGGKIWVESTPGVGSTFFVEFINQNI